MAWPYTEHLSRAATRLLTQSYGDCAVITASRLFRALGLEIRPNSYATGVAATWMWALRQLAEMAGCEAAKRSSRLKIVCCGEARAKLAAILDDPQILAWIMGSP